MHKLFVLIEIFDTVKLCANYWYYWLYDIKYFSLIPIICAQLLFQIFQTIL